MGKKSLRHSTEVILFLGVVVFDVYLQTQARFGHGCAVVGVDSSLGHTISQLAYPQHWHQTFPVPYTSSDGHSLSPKVARSVRHET